MYDYTKKLRSMMFDDLKSVHWAELQIDTPEDLPFEMKTKLNRYNNALDRFDVESAEAVADELLEWLGFKISPAMTT
jgi:hypothetical protein